MSFPPDLKKVKGVLNCVKPPNAIPLQLTFAMKPGLGI